MPNGSSMSRSSYEDAAMSRIDEGDREDLEAYEKALAIRERLAAKDPGNAEWQRAVSVPARDRRYPPGRGRPRRAREAYEKALAVRDASPQRTPAMPNCSARSRCPTKRSAISVGTRATARGPRGLREGPRHPRAPRRKGSRQCQMAARCLGELTTKIGEVRLDEGDRKEALAAYEKALAIRKGLAKDRQCQMAAR